MDKSGGKLPRFLVNENKIINFRLLFELATKNNGL